MPHFIKKFSPLIYALLFVGCVMPHAHAEDLQPLPIGFMSYTFSDVSMDDTKVAIDFYLSKLISHTGNKPKAVIFLKLDKLRQALINQEVDMASLSSIDFLRLQPDSVLTPLLARVQSNGQLFDTYVLLVHKNKQWTSLQDLENTTLRVQNNDDLGSYWLHVELAKAAHPKATTFFKSISQDDRTPQSILSVFFGQADACLVNSATFEAMSKLNPQIEQQLTPILTSPPFISGFLCAHTQMPPQRKAAIKNVSLTLPKSGDGYQIIRLFNTQDVIPFQDDYLSTVLNLFMLYKQYYGTTDLQY